MKGLGFAGVAIVALGATGCARRVTDDECRAMLDRYATLLIHTADPRLPSSEVDRLRIEAQRRLNARRGLASCGGQVSRRAYACAMRANSPDEIERCLL